MGQRRGLVAILLVALAGLLALGCAACGLGGWWLYRQGGLTQRSDASPARRGGELRLSGHEPVTLDPALVQDASSSVYVVEIFGGLVTLDRNLEVAPGLAERWEVSQDGRTYTFYLRREARFHDGRAITAADVKYSLERACSPDLASPTAPTYLADIEGALEVMRGQAKEISGVQVLGDHIVALTIDAPKAYFLAKLTYPTAFVVDRANVAAGPGWADRPNGSGPFRLVSRDRERIVLERNEHYHGGVPALQRVTFVIAGGSPMTMYENGHLDIVNVGLADIERVQDPSNPLSSQLTVVSTLDVQYLGMNTRVAPFDDPKVRQAFAQAIDRRRLADVVLKRMVVPAQGILPPGMPGYTAELRGLQFDPDRALELLRQSRYGDAANLPEVVLHVSGTGGTMPPTIGAIVSMLSKHLGVEVEVHQTPWDQFLRDLNDGRYGFFASGWIADYPDPQNFLDILFHSRSADNRTAYHNPQVDRLLEEARVERDKKRRLELYQQAEALIVQDATWIPLWHGRDYILTKPHVRGAVYSAAIRPWLKDVYLVRGE